MTKALQYLLDLPARHDRGVHSGITSVCSAHPLVIEAALLEAAAHDAFALIEATCNQVNQDGGYTGMTPQSFRDFVLGIATRIDFPADRILFGGDHLGPNPWRKESAKDAMRKAIDMTTAYAQAGFSKIHLDASMACLDDANPLPAKTIAERSAKLAVSAELGAKRGGHPPPAYIIGTEVPVPGGAAEELDVLQPTTTKSADETISLHQQAFSRAGIDDAFTRCIGLVVQPGVEFGHANVIHFDRLGAAELENWRSERGRLVFEAHSTDYQTAEALSGLVKGGFSILKVGPGLTFAMREAFYALDQIAGHICDDYPTDALFNKMEQIMLAEPGYWEDYYTGSDADKLIQRHFSYSDRIRYYWNNGQAAAAVDQLFSALDRVAIPETLISQYMPRQYARVAAGSLPATARDLVLSAIRNALAPYTRACHPEREGIPK